jgi:hypothetical protein
MNRPGMVLLSLGLICLFSACSKDKTRTATASNQSTTASQPAQKAEEPAAETTPPKAEAGELSAGQASGSYTAKGEMVELKYAYAGHAQRFGSEGLVILLTDKPVPPEAVAEEIQSQKMLLDEKIRGLEYVIDKDSYWVRYHPSQYQETKGDQLKDFSIDGDTVKGSDEDSGDFTNGRYSRKVKFVATIIK